MEQRIKELEERLFCLEKEVEAFANAHHHGIIYTKEELLSLDLREQVDYGLEYLYMYHQRMPDSYIAEPASFKVTDYMDTDGAIHCPYCGRKLIFSTLSKYIYCKTCLIQNKKEGEKYAKSL